jgi:hypothetical protein
MLSLRINARAIAIRCRWPLDTPKRRSIYLAARQLDTAIPDERFITLFKPADEVVGVSKLCRVFYLGLHFETTSRKASSIETWVTASGTPYAILFAMVVEKSCGSYYLLRFSPFSANLGDEGKVATEIVHIEFWYSEQNQNVVVPLIGLSSINIVPDVGS